jgi:NifU-like protein involved in Fe-S cluster formation
VVFDTFFPDPMTKLTAILVGVTIYYALQTRKTVEEMVNARKSQFVPALKLEIIQLFQDPEKVQ